MSTTAPPRRTVRPASARRMLIPCHAAPYVHSVRTFRPHWLGRRAYEPVHAMQQRLQQCVSRGRSPTRSSSSEHDPVVTLGRSADRGGHRRTKEFLEARDRRGGTERGGDVTYHGPGRRGLPHLLARARPLRRPPLRARPRPRDVLLCADHGIGAGGRDKFIGAWVDLDRLGAGPATSTPRAPPRSRHRREDLPLGHLHGFALNASTALADFDLIVPCGIRGTRSPRWRPSACGTIPAVEALASRRRPLLKPSSAPARRPRPPTRCDRLRHMVPCAAGARRRLGATEVITMSTTARAPTSRTSAPPGASSSTAKTRTRGAYGVDSLPPPDAARRRPPPAGVRRGRAGLARRVGLRTRSSPASKAAPPRKTTGRRGPGGRRPRCGGGRSTTRRARRTSRRGWRRWAAPSTRTTSGGAAPARGPRAPAPAPGRGAPAFPCEG